MKKENDEEEQEDVAEASEEAEAEPEEEQKEILEETGQEAVEAKEKEEEPELVEEEAKPPLKKKKKKEEEEIVEERTYTIPLRKAWIMPPNKRAPRAIRIIKSFVIKHMKLETQVKEEETPKKLIMTNEVNRKVWSKGIEKPPRKIRVRAAKDKEGNITVYLAE